MTYRRAKSQSKKETRHKYISFIRVLAKLKYVLLFFCRKKKTKSKSLQWKKEWDNQRNSFRKSCKGAGAMQNAPCPKTKQNAFFDLLLQKWAVSHQQTAEISLSKHPILPLFQRYAKPHKSYRIDYLCIANNILHFCVFVFWILTAKWGATEKDCPQGGKAKRGVQ